jgi:acetyl esterase/lipase
MIKNIAYLSIFAVLFCTACSETESMDLNNEVPKVKAAPSYAVLVEEDITYANGLAYNATNNMQVHLPLKLDIYYPNHNSTNRPVYLFIHGGGFQGGTKTKPEIVNMANYFASRGWVFISVDYRTVEDLGIIAGMTPDALKDFYTGFAPQEWIDFSLQNALSPAEVQTSVAMYAAQRDTKAALRWMVANADTYQINTDFISVGGASAGAVTTIALGISNQEDFRDEITTSEDPTLSSTNLNQSFNVRSMVYLWGSNVKLELFESIYGRSCYDMNDPELFMAHGTQDPNPTTSFSEATELQEIYNSLSIYNELIPLEGAGHGAWDATVEGKSLSDMSFNFITQRQQLKVE